MKSRKKKRFRIDLIIEREKARCDKIKEILRTEAVLTITRRTRESHGGSGYRAEGDILFKGAM